MPHRTNTQAMMSDHQNTRREFLKVGALGLGVGLTLPQLLAAGAATGGRGADTSCIFIVQQGGCSQIDSWDMKPAAPLEFRGPLRPIATSVTGTQICELMPRLARRAHRYCVVRSMTHRTTGHTEAMHVCLSGHTQPPRDAAYFGSIVSRLRPSTRNVPSYVWVQEMYADPDVRFDSHYHTGGFLGAAHAPMRVGKGTDNFANPSFRVTAFDPHQDLNAGRLETRRQLVQTVDAPGRVTGTWQPSFQTCRERAYDLLTGADARQAFAIEREPAGLRDRYGRHPLGQNLLAARRLIEAGVRLVTVHAFTGFDGVTNWPPVVNVWDMHGGAVGGPSIFGNNTYGLRYVLPRFDQAVAALLDDLDQRGLLETTLVVAVGEFGRTPRVMTDGRDHYPACYSALLAGAGIRGGAVYGASDAIAAFPKDSPITPEDFGATVLHALGIDPATRLSPDGFTRAASVGRVVGEVFG